MREKQIGPLAAYGDNFKMRKAAFPSKHTFCPDPDDDDCVEFVSESGMTLLDFFAAQYMSAGKLPDEAFRLAALALKEREAYL